MAGDTTAGREDQDAVVVGIICRGAPPGLGAEIGRGREEAQPPRLDRKSRQELPDRLLVL